MHRKCNENTYYVHMKRENALIYHRDCAAPLSTRAAPLRVRKVNPVQKNPKEGLKFQLYGEVSPVIHTAWEWNMDEIKHRP